MLILVLGGARSGKSAVAERLAKGLPQPVTYVATLHVDPDDDDLAARVAAHRERRPSSWRTIEAELDLAARLHATAGTVLVDSLGPWVAAHGADAAVVEDVRTALSSRSGDTVVVSDEVGMSVHPTTAAGLRFRDDLGTVNTAIAAVSDHTLVVVAGRIVTTSALDVDALVAGGG